MIKIIRLLILLLFAVIFRLHFLAAVIKYVFLIIINYSTISLALVSALIWLAINSTCGSNHASN